VDDRAPEEHVITNVAVANGRYFGGGMHVAPEAVIDDGLLDVVTIESMPLLTQGRMMRRMYDGTLLSVPGVGHQRGRRVVAESVDPNEHVLLDIDGEAPGRLPATFELHPGALRLRA
jgi:diacylglycerol kinase family enzyme